MASTLLFAQSVMVAFYNGEHNLLMLMLPIIRKWIDEVLQKKHVIPINV